MNKKILLATEFNNLTKQWTEHCQAVMFSSNIYDYLNHPAYRQLVKLGRPAIPYIVERYRVDDLPWGFVLDEITGLKVIKDPNHFSPPEVKIFWLEWWNKQQPVLLKEYQEALSY